jgi:hypothetical protein
MATIIIECDDELARHVEESARRENKTVSDWVRDRMRSESDRLSLLKEMERRAAANGYPANWMTLYGSLADDESFVAPARSGTRPIDSLD